MNVLDAPGSKRQQAQRQRRAARERFLKARRAEQSLAKQLRGVANEVDKLVKRFAPKGIVHQPAQLNQALHRYATMLGPWAKKISDRFIAELAQRDLTSWSELGKELGRSLGKEIKDAPTGQAMMDIVREQVKLITSLPRQAAERVQGLVMKGLGSSTRAKEIADEILKTGNVTKSRAMLIARTQTTSTATALVEARSTFIGSEGYIWRTSEDSDVRHDHKKLEGKFIPWSRPPVAGPNGQRYHAGAGPNCRCWPEPVIPDRIA